MREKRNYFWIFWAFMFVGAFLVLAQRGYSDGDDAYFYQYTHEMKLTEYLSWRYETWVGRMTAEALVYVTFHLGLWFWRVVNAGMLVLIPLGLLKLAGRTAGFPGSVADIGKGASVAAVSGYLLMGAMTLGYAAVWVNGSIFYTWTFACGIWAMVPLAELVFSAADASGQGIRRKDVPTAGVSVGDASAPGVSAREMSASGVRVAGASAADESASGVRGTGASVVEVSAAGVRGTDASVAENSGRTAWKFIYSIPCAVIASMSIEQMGAVLLTFEVLGVLYYILKQRKVNVLLLIQTILTAIAFAVLFAAPGNAMRVVEEIATWMPEFEGMPFSQHLFITVQWLLSSFANENKLFLSIIWLVGILLLLQKKQKSRSDKALAGIAGVFAVASLLPFAGVTVLSDMGISGIDITTRLDKVPAYSDCTAANLTAMVWWAAALAFTFVFLWKVSDFGITLLLAYLAGIASEAIMFFSPTMYASGARVYYLTDLLYLFVALTLSLKLEKKKRSYVYLIMTVLGVLNFVYQIPSFLAQM